MIHKERIFGLDLMRCTAIIFVLFAHSAFLLPVSTPDQHLILSFFGFMGVEIFFVLSGYLVGKILINLFEKYPVNLHTTFYFWVRRWFRTLPNYYLALLLSIGVFYFANKIFVFEDPTYLLYLLFSQNLVTPHPDFFTLAWSLSVEEWFYFLMPLWFILWSKLFKGRNTFLLTAIVSFILLIIFIRVMTAPFNNQEWDRGVRRVVVFRLDAIMTGVLAAYLHVHYQDFWRKHKKKLLYCGLFLLLLLSASFYKAIAGMQTNSYFFMKTFFFTIISFALSFILPYLSEWTVKSGTGLQKAIVHISRISYSLYLIHVLVFYLVITVLNKISQTGLFGIKLIACWFFCIVLASFLYYTFELPMMNKRDKFKI
jgi:peptidoglycan/LPS O-acetylase OafA/YrhL